MTSRIRESPVAREIPVTREFPRLKLFPPVSRETGISREFPARGFPLNITGHCKQCCNVAVWGGMGLHIALGACRSL